jgi:hypothetical protein
LVFNIWPAQAELPDVFFLDPDDFFFDGEVLVQQLFCFALAHGVDVIDVVQDAGRFES